MLLTDVWFYAIAVPAILLVGISKGGFGGAGGLLAVPTMTLVIGPAQAAAIMLPILCLMDLTGMWFYRGTPHWPNLRIILPGAFVGIALGALGFRYLDAGSLRILIGVVAVGFALDRWLRPRRPQQDKPNVVQGGFWSAVSGFTSFVAHAGGPPITGYLLQQKLDKTAYVGTTVFYFAAVNYVKLVPYAWLGQFSHENLMTSLVLLPLAPAGIGLGIWLHRRVNERWFFRSVYALLFIVGLWLIGESLFL